MCSCKVRGFTAGLVCCCLVLAPFGAKNPPASAVGHVLLTTASSTASISMVTFSIPNTATGAVHRLPIELPRPAAHEPDKHRYS
jgi:hypothetical protein